MNCNTQFVSTKMRTLLAPAIADDHYFETSALQYDEIEFGYIAPYFGWRKSIGGVIDKYGQMIIDSRNDEWEESSVPYHKIEPVIRHEIVIYIGVLVCGFGHTFTDDLRKLWFLSTDSYNEMLRQGAHVVYTTDLNQDLPQYAIEILNYAGYDICQAEHIVELTRFDKIIVPQNSFFAGNHGRSYTKEYVASIQNIINNVSKTDVLIEPIEKIYLSRSKYSKLPQSRAEQGEDVIEREMNKLGYTSIIPEDHTFAEQIFLVRNCSYLATTEGSIAHISVFCKPDTGVTIICKGNYLNFHQVAINQLAALDVTYVEAHHSYKISKEVPWYGPFYLCVTRCFEKYIGHRIWHMPFFLRLSFWKYMRVIPRAVNKVCRIFNIDYSI